MSNEELVAAIQQGKNVQENKAELVKQMWHFMYGIALKFKAHGEIEDLAQEAYFGLEKAIAGYDAEKGFKFTTYAGYWIAQSIQGCVYNKSDTVRLSAYARERVIKYNKAVDNLIKLNGEPPTAVQIAQEMGLTVEEVETIRLNQIKQNNTSLNTFIGDDTEKELQDTIPAQCDVENDVCDKLQQEQLKVVLWGCVDELPEREATIIYKHYRDGAPYADIGLLLGISSARVGQLMEQAIKRLRCKKTIEALEPFINDTWSCAVQGVGVGAYNRSWTSATERVVLQRERYNELMGNVMTEMEALMRTENVPRN